MAGKKRTMSQQEIIDKRRKAKAERDRVKKALERKRQRKSGAKFI